MSFQVPSLKVNLCSPKSLRFINFLWNKKNILGDKFGTISNS